MFTMPGHKNWVRSSKIAPDARLVVSGSDDHTVRLWDVETSKEL
jgi:centriolar protein POC1